MKIKYRKGEGRTESEARRPAGGASSRGPQPRASGWRESGCGVRARAQLQPDTAASCGPVRTHKIGVSIWPKICQIRSCGRTFGAHRSCACFVVKMAYTHLGKQLKSKSNGLRPIFFSLSFFFFSLSFFFFLSFFFIFLLAHADDRSTVSTMDGIWYAAGRSCTRQRRKTNVCQFYDRGAEKRLPPPQTLTASACTLAFIRRT